MLFGCIIYPLGYKIKMAFLMTQVEIYVNLKYNFKIT